MRINGMPSNSQSINIEGQDATNGFFKQQNQINQAGMDAIQEVAIQTSNFAAEYGQAGGGYFNYTMKSGTNQLHGSGLRLFRERSAERAACRSRTPAPTTRTRAGQHVRNPLRQNDYGFTLGGPIEIPKIYNGHDKTFFFFNFEQFRQSAFTSNTVGIVPTAAQRNGDFSAALSRHLQRPIRTASRFASIEIFDPATQSTVNGIQERAPFPNNTIPVSRFDPTAVIIQNMIPLPNSPGLFNYTAPGYSNFRHTTIPSFKIDHNLSEKMKLSGYYSATKTVSPQTNGFPQAVYRPAASERFGADHTPQFGYDADSDPAAACRRGLSAHVQSADRPGLRPESSCFPQGVPFQASLLPLHGGHVQHERWRLERWRRLPGSHEYGRCVHSHAARAGSQANI